MINEGVIASLSQVVLSHNRQAAQHLSYVPREGLSVWAHAMLSLHDLDQHFSLISCAVTEQQQWSSSIDQLNQMYTMLSLTAIDDDQTTIDAQAHYHAKFTAIKLLQHLLTDVCSLAKIGTGSELSDAGFQHRVNSIIARGVGVEFNRKTMLLLMLKPYCDAAILKMLSSAVFKKLQKGLLFDCLLSLSRQREFATKEEIWLLFEDFDQLLMSVRSADRLFSQVEGFADALLTVSISSLMLRAAFKKRVMQHLCDVARRSSSDSVHPEFDLKSMNSEIVSMVDSSAVFSMRFLALEDVLATLSDAAILLTSIVSKTDWFVYKNALRQNLLQLDQLIAECISQNKTITVDLLEQYPSWDALLELTEKHFSALPEAISSQKQAVLQRLALCLISRLSHEEQLQQSISRAVVSPILKRDSESGARQALMASLEQQMKIDRVLSNAQSDVDQELTKLRLSPLLSSHFQRFAVEKMQQQIMAEPEILAHDEQQKKRRLRDLLIADAVAVSENFRYFESCLAQCREYICSARFGRDRDVVSNFDSFSHAIKAAVLECYTSVLDAKLHGHSTDERARIMAQNWQKVSAVADRYMKRLPSRQSLDQEKKFVFAFSILSLGLLAIGMFCYNKCVYGEFSLIKPRSYSATIVDKATAVASRRLGIFDHSLSGRADALITRPAYRQAAAAGS